jgi:tetrahydromethanopterin S-methyltransferase subunit C
VGRPRRPAWFAWWYVSIAAGFLLLAIRAQIVGGWTPAIIVRVVIALGFAGLAWAEMRRNAR